MYFTPYHSNDYIYKNSRSHLHPVAYLHVANFLWIASVGKQNVSNHLTLMRKLRNLPTENRKCYYYQGYDQSNSILKDTSKSIFHYYYIC